MLHALAGCCLKKSTLVALGMNLERVDVDRSAELELPVIVGCLNWIALRTRPDITWATSQAASLITHGPDTCFIRVKHICQYLHHTLG